MANETAEERANQLAQEVRDSERTLVGVDLPTSILPAFPYFPLERLVETIRAAELAAGEKVKMACTRTAYPADECPAAVINNFSVAEILKEK